jgi:hypothetical protein
MPQELREYRISFERVPAGEAAHGGKLGLRSKLGGKPDWDQGEETPLCSDCQMEMVFVGQLDSIEHDEQHNPHRVNCLSPEQQYMMGDVGMIYIFFCFDCCRSTSVFQCG